MSSKILSHSQIETWQWRSLVVMLYSLPLHEVTKNLSWGACFFLTLLSWMNSGFKLKISKIPLWLLGWIGCGVFVSIHAISPYDSWKGVWDIFRATSTFWMVATSLKKEDRAYLLVRHLILGTLFASLIATREMYFAWKNWNPGITKIIMQLHSVGHFNQSGMFLAMIWVLVMASIHDPRIFGVKAKMIVILFFTGLSLFMTTARTSCAVAFFVSLVCLWRSTPHRWLKFFFLTSSVIVLMAIMISSNLRERILFQGSFRARVGCWITAVEAFTHHPWTGVGLNNFKNVTLYNENPEIGGTVDHAHNLYFNTLAQMGAPGIMILLGLLGALGHAIWKIRPLKPEDDSFSFRASAGVWLVLVLTGLSNTPLHHENAMLFFITMGILGDAT